MTTTPLSSFLTASTCSTTTLASSIFGDSGQKKSFLDRTLNFRTSVGRYFLLVLILTAGFIPAAILLAQNIVIVFKAVKNLDKNNLVQTNIESALLIKDLLHDVQLERGHSALYLSSDGEIRTRDDMLRSRLNVDDIFMALKSWPRSLLSYPGTVPNKTVVRVDLMTFRHSIDTRVVDEYGVVQFYSQIIDLLIKWMQELMNAITLGNFWPEIVAFQALTFATENAGLERANGAIFFTKGFVSWDKLADYMGYLVRGRQTLVQAAEFSSLVSRRVQQADFVDVTAKLQGFRSLIYSNGTANGTVVKWDPVGEARAWMGNMTEFIDTLHHIQDELGAEILSNTLYSSSAQRKSTTFSSCLMVVEFCVYPVFIFLTLRLTNRVKDYSKKLAERLKILAREQRRNATLVKEMYPASVAARLLKGNSVEPEIFESATVCFSGLSDFQELSRISHGVDIIFFINRLFDLMDDEISKYDVFKVETVGDQYLVVSGVPLRNGDSHVKEIANMALGLLEQTKNLTVDHLPTYPIQLKFGVCTGSVVAGIVGLKMPRYCLFGDTMNMASRMQTSSQALHIHLSATSGSLLSRDPTYDVRFRGDILIKGKGVVPTYWLNGRKTGW